MRYLKHLGPWVLALFVAACTAPPERPPTPAVPEVPAAALPVPPAPPAAPSLPSPPPAPAPPAPPASGVVTAPLAGFPADVLYLCVKQSGGERQQTPIEYLPKVRELCQRHPEMGPCQYERDLCRRGGGRVFGHDGTEITMATEAEYDRKVMRVRFRSD